MSSHFLIAGATTAGAFPFPIDACSSILDVYRSNNCESKGLDLQICGLFRTPPSFRNNISYKEVKINGENLIKVGNISIVYSENRNHFRQIVYRISIITALIDYRHCINNFEHFML